jgi:hypothetical protein
MFPESFVQRHLIWARNGHVVFDPFSGRGTTVLSCLLAGHPAAACDVNPVAICLSRAKAHLPKRDSVLKRLENIERTFQPCYETKLDPFYDACFHKSTLQQIIYLRKVLEWRKSNIDCFLAATVLGRLHGESHRSLAYLSNRMPRTISTKPDYSMRWWKKNGYVAPERDAFAVVRNDVLYRYASEIPSITGRVRAGNARRAAAIFPELTGKVGLVITSPPYLDTTNFEEDQWLRLWFLGGPDRPNRVYRGDHRHFSAERYWTFLTQVWAGISALLRRDARLIIRIGGPKLDFATAEEGLGRTLRAALGGHLDLVEKRISFIKDGQHRSFRPALRGKRAEYDFHWQLAG